MKEILLTQGQFAIVDDADYDWLNQHKWFACKAHSGYFYAVRQSPRKDGEQHHIYMHREILGLEPGDSRQADHIHHNTLDNHRVNLRICTRSQNQMNRVSNSNTTSRFKGVTWYNRFKKWNAYIYINGKRKHLGYWDMEEVAALAYDMVAIREHGEFACLNF